MQLSSSITAGINCAGITPDFLRLPESSRILELAGLCDRIARTVLENRLSADPLPPEDVIAEQYDMISADFYVTVDDSKATGNTLEFSLTVTP